MSGDNWFALWFIVFLAQFFYNVYKTDKLQEEFRTLLEREREEIWKEVEATKKKYS